MPAEHLQGRGNGVALVADEARPERHGGAVLVAQEHELLDGRSVSPLLRRVLQPLDEDSPLDLRKAVTVEIVLPNVAWNFAAAPCERFEPLVLASGTAVERRGDNAADRHLLDQESEVLEGGAVELGGVVQPSDRRVGGGDLLALQAREGRV